MPNRILTRDEVGSPLARVVDFGCVVMAYALATLVACELARSRMFIWPAASPSDILGWPAQYVVLLLVGLLARGVIATQLGIHRRSSSETLPAFLGQAARGALLWTVAIGVSIFLFKLSDVSRLFVLSFVAIGSVLILLCGNLERFLYERKEDNQEIAVVIGQGAQGDWLTAYLRKHFTPWPYTLVRRLDSNDLARLRGSGSEFVKEFSISVSPGTLVEAFVAGADMSADASEIIPRLLKNRIKTHVLPAVFDASIFRLSLTDIGGVPLIVVRGGELDPLEAGVKRLIDFAGSALALVVVSPLLALVAMLIKLSSPGPVLFRQERLGKHGKTIYIYKFRTMLPDAESILKSNEALYREYVSNNYKLPSGRDPRITRVGRVLRQLSLDELPQLINVLKGEMSLVGPRPVVPEEIQQYGDCASMVLSVQPGLTGQWQVSGRSDIVDYAQRIQLDMEYLRDQSIVTDLRILAKTVPAVLLRQGAH